MKNIAVLLLSLLFIGGFAVSGQAAPDEKPVCKFPGFTSLKSSKPISQWQRVTEIMKAEPLTDDFALPQGGGTLKALREKTATMTPVEKLGVVNDAWNKASYIEDSANWGSDDYWATPYEMARKNGDVEDFCIAKYYTLKYLGFAPEQMWIVIGKDIRSRLDWAILAVKVDDEQYILSNQVKPVLSKKDFPILPAYALNELEYVRLFPQTPPMQKNAE